MGSHIVDAFLERGHKIRVFDRPKVDLDNLSRCLGQIELVRGDFLNENDLSLALSDIDAVVHLVGTTLPKSSNDAPVYDVESNVVGSLKLLELSRKHGVRKTVFASSGGTVYGPSAACPISETQPTDPICSYGITKLTIEKYLQLFHHLYNLDYVVLRIANPFGERQDPRNSQGAVTVFLWKLLQGEPITIWGDGTVARDYFYIGDLVSAFVAAIETETPSRLYNIGSGVPHTLNQLLHVMQAVTRRIPVVHYMPARKLDVPINFLDVARARRELLWQPRISLQEGITRTWRWLQGCKIA